MKIRQGFVSNSSSSSFMIYGINLDSDQIEKLKESLSEEDREALEDEGVGYIEEVFSDNLLSIQSVMGEEFYLGRSLVINR